MQQELSSTKEKWRDQHSLGSNKSEIVYTLLLIYRLKVCNYRSYRYKGTLFNSVVHNSYWRCRRAFALFWHLFFSL